MQNDERGAGIDVDFVKRLDKSGQGRELLEYLEERHRIGARYAITEIGALHARGCGSLDRDYNKAVAAFLESVRLYDDVTSRLALVRLYLEDDSLDPDKELAKRHLTLLASRGEMNGFFGLGLIYHYGLGVNVDLEEAQRNYSEAIERGHIRAKIELMQIDSNYGVLRSLVGIIQYRIIRAMCPSSPKIGLT